MTQSKRWIYKWT